MADLRTFPPLTDFGTTTSWLPLTTEFPYQEGCSTAFWSNNLLDVAAIDPPVAFDPKYGFRVDARLKCVPDQVSSWWSTQALSLVVNGRTTRYSIGPVVCPEAYVTVSTGGGVGASTVDVVCCPSSYTFASSLYQPGIIGECRSSISSGQVVVYVRPSGTDDMDAVHGFYTTSTTMAEAFSAWGIPVHGVNFVARTTSSSTLPTSSSLLTSSSTGSSTSTSASGTPNSSKDGSSGSSGLEKGAIAGIVVGAVFAIAIVIAFGVFKLRPRRRRDAVDPTNLSPAQGSLEKDHRGSELHGYSMPVEAGGYEQQRIELHGRQIESGRNILDPRGRRHELSS